MTRLANGRIGIRQNAERVIVRQVAHQQEWGVRMPGSQHKTITGTNVEMRDGLHYVEH